MNPNKPLTEFCLYHTEKEQFARFKPNDSELRGVHWGEMDEHTLFVYKQSIVTILVELCTEGSVTSDMDKGELRFIRAVPISRKPSITPHFELASSAVDEYQEYEDALREALKTMGEALGIDLEKELSDG